MDKQIVTYLYNRILPSNKKEQTTYTQKSTGESLKYGTYQKEPRTKRVLWLLKYVYKIFLMLLLLKVQSNSSQQSALTIRPARERIFCHICFYRRNISVIARCSLVLPKFLCHHIHHCIVFLLITVRAANFPCLPGTRGSETLLFSFR